MRVLKIWKRVTLTNSVIVRRRNFSVRASLYGIHKIPERLKDVGESNDRSIANVTLN